MSETKKTFKAKPGRPEKTLQEKQEENDKRLAGRKQQMEEAPQPIPENNEISALDAALEAVGAPKDSSIAKLIANLLQPEPLESCEVELPDGRSVIMRKPAEALQFRIYRIWGDKKITKEIMQYTLAILHVSEINGKVLKPITSEADLLNVANEIGYAGVEVLSAVLTKHFPQMTSLDDLKVIKKNLP